MNDYVAIICKDGAARTNHQQLVGEYPDIGLKWMRFGASGGGEGNRTLGPLHAKQVLSR